jgi:hypothetical protein
VNTNHTVTAIKDRLAEVRDSLGEAHPSIPACEIIARARRRRVRRRLIPGMTGALALAAGTAVAVTALLPASHQTGHQPTTQLAAWTVTRLADGNIKVTIRELKDPAGLQRKLRADGVPASVTFASQENAACRLYPGGTPGQPPHNTPLLLRVFPKPYQLLPKPYQRSHGPVIRPGRARSTVAHARSNRLRISPHVALIVIHPPALPGNAGVQIATVYQGQRGAQAVDMPTVVYASRRCTGS